MKMTILENGDNDNKLRINNYKATFHNGDEDRKRKSLFGSYPDLDTILWLKRLALDPCKLGAPSEESKRSSDQILNVRKVMLMTNSESPRRKRKFQQFLKNDVATATRLDSQKYNQQIYSNLSRGHLSASSDMFVLNSSHPGKSVDKKAVRNSRCSGSFLTPKKTPGGKVLSFLDDAINLGAPTLKNSSPLFGSDKYANDFQLTSKTLTLQGLSVLNADVSAHSSSPQQLNIRQMPIPIGPRFQADVPDWVEPVNKVKLNGIVCDLQDLRYVGTRFWPVEGKSTEISLKEIGKGRPDSCSCIFPASSDCIKHHIKENRLKLKSEIGFLFFSWKFDKMGEAVSNSWTSKEQQTFSLLRLKGLTNESIFWDQASKMLPSKSPKSILSYYFNVFIPRNLSIRTKLPSKQVDSDDEAMEDGDDHTSSQERWKARNDGTHKSSIVKTQYMHQAYR